MWSRIAAATLFVGFNMTFFPQFLLGIAGMPRRYHTYPAKFQVLHDLSSIGALVLAIGYLMPAVYLLWSLRYGERASNNPWNATGLEWTHASSPPETHNFTEVPVVTHGPYNYD
jgi:cytochrome c oxidase subunit 1